MDIPFSGRVKDLKVFFSGGGTKQKIFNNFFWLGFSEFVSRLLKLVLIIYVARILGATEYGKFTFAMAFFALWSAYRFFYWCFFMKPGKCFFEWARMRYLTNLSFVAGGLKGFKKYKVLCVEPSF